MQVVEFVSYDGECPNLCSGKLVVKINGVEYSFDRCLSSGGSVSFDEDWSEEVTEGEWTFSFPYDQDKSIFNESLRRQIEQEVNYNVQYGCCGGCV